MSKSPSTGGLFLPALGIAALVLGVAYGVATTNYGKDRIAALEHDVGVQRAAAEDGTARAAQLQEALATAERTAQDQIAALRTDAETRSAALQQELDALRAERKRAAEAGQATLQDRAGDAPPTDEGNTRFGLGREALPEEIAAWDVDVLPDGRGLPEGSGDVWTGEEVFVEKCAACHGDFAEGRDAWPVLAGGFDTLDDRDPVKTVGSYWPYLSTVWDYVHRSMPFGAAGTLSDDEVYAITAYILYSNDLVDEDFTLSRESFDKVEMYNDDGFIVDDRPDTEYMQWRAEPCMTDCRDAPAEITRRATDVGVTPADDGSMAESVMEQQLAALGGTEWGKERVAGSVFMDPNATETDEAGGDDSQQASTDGDQSSDAAASGTDPALVAAGEKVFRKCASCHQVGEGARNRSGPHLNGIVGRVAGSIDGFKYSSAFQAANTEGLIWTDESLHAFLRDPKGYIDGTKMSFRGLQSDEELAAIAAYLATLSP